MRIIYQTNDVERALAEIHRYTLENWGEAQANKYLKNILSCFHQLAENASLGHRHRLIDDPYRIYPTGRHYIVYRYNSKAIYITAILHESMDIASHITKISSQYH